jgi:cysteine desulfurase
VLAAARGVAASTGSACHSGQLLPPDVVVQLGVDPESALGTVRLSLGFTTTVDHVTRAADALTSAWQAVTGRGTA